MPIYEIRSFTSIRLQADKIASYIKTQGKSTVESAGGTLFAAFQGHIGASRDEGIVITRWKDGDAALRGGRLALVGCSELVESKAEAYLEATLRPGDEDASPGLGGVYALRWFHRGLRIGVVCCLATRLIFIHRSPVPDDKVEEHISLSGSAWPAFESNFQAKVFGLFRALGDSAAYSRMLLCTNYSSMAEWFVDFGGLGSRAVLTWWPHLLVREKSRMVKPETEQQAETRATFQARSAMLRYESVNVYTNMLI
jgi:hypothetical protein